MERLIDATAKALGNGIGWLAESGLLFVAFGVLWLGFGAAILWSQGSLDAVWQWIRGLPLIAQALVWLLFLPVMIGLWIWESGWHVVVRLILVAGVAGWNLLVFLPRAAQTARP